MVLTNLSQLVVIMRFATFAFVLTICGIAVASPTHKSVGKIADKVFLENQKNILRLLQHVHQPNSYKDQVQIAKTWNIEANMNMYSNQQAIKEFVQLYRTEFLPQYEIFSIMDEVQRRQVISLFNVFYNAKTFDTFYKTACWAREYVNEGMFVYAMTVAVLHRPDTKGMVLPAPYEIYPSYFITDEVIQKAHQYKMQNFAYYTPEYQTRNKDPMHVQGQTTHRDQKNKLQHQHFMAAIDHKFSQAMRSLSGKNVADKKVVIIPANYTGWYLNVDVDQKLSYFTEDVGLNSYYYYFHIDYPFWMKGSQFGLNKDRRGEQNYYVHQQLVARYYLERLSNDLGRIDLVDVKNQAGSSYIPSLRYSNGLEFPYRPTHTDIVHDDFTLVNSERIHTLEQRIMTAVDSGYVQTEDGNKVPIYNEKGINLLGNLVEGNPDSMNTRLYSYLQIYAKILLGFSSKPIDNYKLQPSVLEHYETAMRDPIFYSIYKKILLYFNEYKKNLPSYTYTDLAYPGVKVENIVIDKLITYFDYFDIELNNAIYNDFTKETEQPDVIVKARQMRLNHKPFTYKINVASDKSAKVTIRVFLGPKYDEKGNQLNLNENRVNFVEIDQFVYEMQSGKNVIERNSRQLRHTVRDRTSYYTLYQRVMSAIEGSEQFVLDQSEAHCGFPNRLVLPKGKRGGMVFQLFTVISPYQEGVANSEEDSYTCGVGSGNRYIDNLPLGYPLDRKIDIPSFNVPNMHFQDVVIYHKHLDEINLTQA